jgi:hypothetical protein
MHEPRSVGEILDCIDGLAREREQVSLGAIVESFGHRGYGAVLMMPVLIDWSPLGGIPGLQSFLALVAAIVSAQILFGREHLWLPGFVTRRAIGSAGLRAGAARMRGVARFMDRHFHGRLRWLTHAPFSRVAAVVVILICLAVPPLDLIPFGGSGPMLAIALVGLALLVGDGALMLAALTLSVAAAAVGLSLWAGIGGG